MYIAIDFDGTIVKHEYPEIGEPVPGAFKWMRLWQLAGAQLILWTMRCDSEKDGPVLTDAIDFCKWNGIIFLDHNKNPTQHWSLSPKCYAHIYVDDAAEGCPLIYPAQGRPYVDWSIVGPNVYNKMMDSK